MGAEVVLLLEPGGEGKRRAHGGQLQESRRRPPPQPPHAAARTSGHGWDRPSGVAGRLARRRGRRRPGGWHLSLLLPNSGPRIYSEFSDSVLYQVPGTHMHTLA